MCNFNIKRQINKLYTLTTVSYFRIAGASWVALLALRGFSLLQIGILESIFISQAVVLRFHQVLWQMFFEGKGHWLFRSWSVCCLVWL